MRCWLMKSINKLKLPAQMKHLESCFFPLGP